MNTVAVLKAILPRKYHPVLRQWFNRLRAPLYHGDKVFCPCCGGRFRAFLRTASGDPNGLCPGCTSASRHRLLQLYLENRTRLFQDDLRVLEHVPDDRKAISEMYRVLRPGGLAVVQVPLDDGRAETYEDPEVTDPAERAKLFGQADHVRVYGRDLTSRLGEAGFHVTVERYAEELTPLQRERMGIRIEPLFVCRKGT